jgi:hypothetical protein
VIDALLLMAALLGVAAASFLVARSPRFWIGLGKVVAAALMPKLLRAVRPKNFTKKQLEKIARGEDPLSGETEGGVKVPGFEIDGVRVNDDLSIWLANLSNLFIHITW